MAKDPTQGVFDPNASHPSEPPPSYEQAMSDPQIDVSDPNLQDLMQNQSNQPQNYQNQSNQPQDYHQNQQTPALPPRPTSGQFPGNSHSSYHTSTAAGSTGNSTGNSAANPAADLYTNNLSLPWRYPRGYFCKHCKNTGYKKSGKKCHKCWDKFAPWNSNSSQQYYQPAGPPLNPGVSKLPPGMTVQFPVTNSHANVPVMVLPGDARIGGQVCYRCHGRGQVHFFLDMETCPVCNGLGRIP